MKLQTIVVKDGETSTEDKNYNFDRVVKVTIYYGSKDAPGAVIFEYAPLDKEQKCPRIEAVVNDLMQPQRKSGRPGFTAEITLYNIGDTAETLLSQHGKFIQEYTRDMNRWQQEVIEDANKDKTKILKQYYDEKARVRLDCGYWDHESGQAIYGEVPLFEGYINSSLNYLKGNDQITKLYCHDFDAGQISNKAIAQSLGGTYSAEDKEKWYALSKEDEVRRSGKYAGNWAAMASRLVRFWQKEKPNPGYENTAIADTVNALGFQKEFKPTTSADIQLPRLPVTDSDREKHDWFRIIYLSTPADKNSRNPALESRLASMDVSGFFANGVFINDMLNELCNYKDADVSWMVDYNYERGAVVYFIYPTGEWAKSTKGENAEIKIYNFQNILEIPTVTADGSLNIKMFLNKECIPGRRIALMQDKAIGGGFEDLTISAGLGQYDWLAPGGKISAYGGFNIRGAKTSALYTLQNTKDFSTGNGYMFNIGFPIITARHEISTHGDAWYTTVKTVPSQAGILGEKKSKK